MIKIFRITLYKYCRHVSPLSPSLPTVSVSELFCTEKLYPQMHCLRFGGRGRHSSCAREKIAAVSCEKLVTASQSTGRYTILILFSPYIEDSRPSLFNYVDGAPSAHWTGDWEVLTAGLEGMERKTSLSYVGNRTNFPRLSRQQPSHCSDWATSVR